VSGHRRSLYLSTSDGIISCLVRIVSQLSFGCFSFRFLAYTPRSHSCSSHRQQAERKKENRKSWRTLRWISGIGEIKYFAVGNMTWSREWHVVFICNIICNVLLVACSRNVTGTSTILYVNCTLRVSGDWQCWSTSTHKLLLCAAWRLWPRVAYYTVAQYVHFVLVHYNKYLINTRDIMLRVKNAITFTK
jgi:hypothetical protein